MEGRVLAEITTVFSAIGGVILTNGWDRSSRREGANAFHLNWEELQDRHELTFPAFDAGQITLDEYLDRTLFYQPRSFTRDEFMAFMFKYSSDRKSTRLNSSHVRISYAVFCLKKKNKLTIIFDANHIALPFT